MVAMLSEKEMEDQIASHPERFLGERQLSVVARQFRIGGYIFDLLFEDRHGGKLIVEIQKGTLDRNHTYKILDYYDEYRENNPLEFIDVMVVANQITYERKKRLHALGVEYRELPEQLFDQVNEKQPEELNPVNKVFYPSPATTAMLTPDDLVTKLIEIGYVARQNQEAQALFVNLGGPQSPINKNQEKFKGLILLNPKMDTAFGSCNIEKILHFRDRLMVNTGEEWKRREGVPGDGKRVTLDFDLEENQTSGRSRIICRTENGEIFLDGYVGQLPLHDGLYSWEEVQEFRNQVISEIPATVAEERNQRLRTHREELIEVAEDYEGQYAQEPPNGTSKTIARIEYELLIAHPYKFTERELFHEVHVVQRNKPHLKIDSYNIKRCLLVQSFGWGIHRNREGKLALVVPDSDQYKELQGSANRARSYRKSKQ